MFFFLSKILDIALSPLAWAIGLCFVGLLAHRKKNPRRLARLAPIGAAVLLYVFSIEPVSNALWGRLETPLRKSMRTDVTYDAVILLGGIYEDRATETFGQTSYNENIERLLVTFDLLRTGKAKRAILSGGPSDAAGLGVAEANVLAKQLEDWGIARDRLIIEDHSRNTRENAVQTARMAREHGWQTLLMVTSAFHMPRAIECFNAVGLEVDTLPVDYRSFDGSRYSSGLLPRAGSLNQSTAAIREMVGRIVYRVQGYGSAKMQPAP